MRLFLLLLPAVLCAQPVPRMDEPDNPLTGDPAAVEAGRKLFSASCGACHGATGEGGRGPNLRDGKLIRRSSDFQMFNTIRKGVPGSDMPGANLPDANIWQLVTFVRALGAPAAETIVPGEPSRGELVYAKSGCAGCHMISGRGGTLGPDLSNIGAARSYEYLRESVLKPGERISAGYQPVTVKLKDGRTLEGVARNYTNYSFQLMAKDGKLYLLNASDLADAKVDVASLMPADYGERLSKEEMTDLVAYLSKRTLRPVEARRRPERRRGAPR